MKKYQLGILNGDDIGLEVVPVAVQVMKAALERYPEIKVEWVELPIGYSAYQAMGETFPKQIMDTLYTLDGWILGPIGHMAYPKEDPKAVNPHPIIRRKFDLVSNVRPAKSHPRLPCLHQNVDVVIIRENNEGFQPDRNMYKGIGEFMPTPDLAMSVRVITRRNSELVARSAFALARQRNGMKKVTAIHKNTVYKMGCSLFLEACQDVSRDFPDVTFDSMVVDTFAMKLVMRPQNFDVIVTTNMFGDILSDEAAGLVGGLGMAPGLCLGPKYVMAQATHGSAPDIAGKQIANPYAMIMSGQMMLAWLGMQHHDEKMIACARDMESAVISVLDEMKEVTSDLGGTATTTEMGKAICRKL
jgi:3-isopropylmalate dehydrogenase